MFRLSIAAADDDSHNFNVKVKAKTILTQPTFARHHECKHKCNSKKEETETKLNRAKVVWDALWKTSQTNTRRRKIVRDFKVQHLIVAVWLGRWWYFDSSHRFAICTSVFRSSNCTLLSAIAHRWVWMRRTSIFRSLSFLPENEEIKFHTPNTREKRDIFIPNANTSLYPYQYQISTMCIKQMAQQTPFHLALISLSLSFSLLLLIWGARIPIKEFLPQTFWNSPNRQCHFYCTYL